MAYLDAEEAFGVRKLTAIGSAGAINLGIGAALVFGLTVSDWVPPIIEENPDVVNVITPVPLDPPPPPPNPRPDVKQPDSVIQVPTPPRNLATDTPFTVEPGPIVIDPFVVKDPIGDDPIQIIPDPPKPPPPPAEPMFDPVAASPKNNIARWVTPGDYSTRDLREGNEGITGFRVSVDIKGRVSDCQITKSSGHTSLDSRTCDKVTRRARFNPAKDDTGAIVSGNYTGSVRWQIPE